MKGLTSTFLVHSDVKVKSVKGCGLGFFKHDFIIFGIHGNIRTLRTEGGGFIFMDNRKGGGQLCQNR